MYKKKKFIPNLKNNFDIDLVILFLFFTISNFFNHDIIFKIFNITILFHLNFNTIITLFF